VNQKLLALYGLKWNPFTPGVPAEALHVTARLHSFCWRVGQLAGEGDARQIDEKLFFQTCAVSPAWCRACLRQSCSS